MGWRLPQGFEEKVYSGWLGKVIGVRLGAPIEGWTYDRIRRTFGEITGYVRKYDLFAADDDTNGPMIFIRALEDYECSENLTAEHISYTWLNYIGDHHGTLWWGGYGRSTENTAYINLKNGIMAPRSGSVEQNGAAVAEQIGGQIFIDTWGLVTPGNPDLAANLAAKAASVSHGGDGIHGGVFIATMISAAFVEQDIAKLLDIALTYIEGSHYAKMVRDIMRFYRENPDDWRKCFEFIHDNYGYDRYPGNCHIIPNSAVIVMSLLYGGGDFSKSICICNMAGWDTDCNVGNVGTILGVIRGRDGIPDFWTEQIRDELVSSSNIGTRNLMDLPECAAVLVRLAYRLAGEMPSSDIGRLLTDAATARCHFEFPGSTHGFRLAQQGDNAIISFVNTDEIAHTGNRSLKLNCAYLQSKHTGRIFKRTYYRQAEFDDNRYEPSFSPRVYPGQTLSAAVYLPEGEPVQLYATLYAVDGNNNGARLYSKAQPLVAGKWQELNWRIPPCRDGLITEVGILVENRDRKGWNGPLYLDDFSWSGAPEYGIDFSKERQEFGSVSQFTYLRGSWKLEDGSLSGSSAEVGEAYTGDIQWRDYEYGVTIIPQIGDSHRLLFRVRGAMHSYALGLEADNRLVLWKNNLGYTEVAAVPFTWEPGVAYRLTVTARGNTFEACVDGKPLIQWTDTVDPYRSGQIGVGVVKGRTYFRDIAVRGLE